MPSKPVPLRLGQRYDLTPEDVRFARAIAKGQHANSGAVGTRGRGASFEARLEGTLGEVAVAGMLGIPAQCRVLDGPDRKADIEHDGWLIEVKNGLPLVHRSRRTFRVGALYVAVEADERTSVLTHMAPGRVIRDADLYPPEWACPRYPEQNYWFGDLWTPPEPKPPSEPRPAKPPKYAYAIGDCPTLAWVWRYGSPEKDRNRCPTCGGPGRVRKGSYMAEHRPVPPDWSPDATP